MAQIRTVLCFGDSNTYGVVPSLARAGGRRFAPDRRWPGVLRRQLGSDWVVIEEGHPGRTTIREDPIEGLHKSGLKALPICLESHMPIDLVIVLLGTNDLKHRFAATPSDISDSLEVLVRAIRRSEAGPGGAEPAVLVVSPVPILEVGRYGDMFLGGAAKSAVLSGHVREMAQRNGVAFLDAGSLVEVSPADGIHVDSEAHRILGVEVAKSVQAIFAGK